MSRLLPCLHLQGVSVAQGVNPYALSGISTGQGHSVGHSTSLKDYHANTNSGIFKSDKDKHSVKFRLGADFNSEKYTERFKGAKFMQEDANLVGITAGVDIPLSYKSYFAFDGSYSIGDSTYTGSTHSGSYGDLNHSGVDRYVYKISGTYKRQFDSLLGTTLGVGVDYRELKDKLSKAGYGGYDRTNKTLWGHIIAERGFELTSRWTFTPQVKGSYLIKGTQKSELNHIIGQDISHRQNKGYGWELGLGFTKDLGSYDITLKPYYRLTDIKDSKVSRGTIEPRNKTKELGLQVFFTF